MKFNLKLVKFPINTPSNDGNEGKIFKYNKEGAKKSDLSQLWLICQTPRLSCKNRITTYKAKGYIFQSLVTNQPMLNDEIEEKKSTKKIPESTQINL